MIGVIDYGAGNLFSLGNSLDRIGAEYRLVSDPSGLEAFDGLILPGVGAFPDAMRLLSERGLVEPVRQAAEKKPLLGICLGMQLLFGKSEEFGLTEGLGLIPGTVVRMKGEGVKIPHMGWNELILERHCALTENLPPGSWMYFVHSFRAVTPDENISCSAEHGERFPALVARGHVYGAQFHPEKSGDAGLAILQSFKELL